MLNVVKPLKNFGGYSEVSQVNPLRWRLCLRDGDKLIPQSNWWKCKDFLNDVVIYLRTGHVFSVYSFNNEQKINEEGGYMALKNVHESFEKNLPVLNGYLLSKGFPGLSLVPCKATDETTHVVLIPTVYWQNTFYISYITALIRSCCFKEESTIEKLVEHEHYLQGGWFKKLDKMFETKYTEEMNKHIFINYQYSGKNKDFSNTYSIHNAGMQTWYNSAGQQGLSIT